MTELTDLLNILLLEVILVVVACVLFLLGVSTRATVRRLAPVLALATLAGVFAMQVWVIMGLTRESSAATDAWNTVYASAFSDYIKLLTSGVGALMVLLAWPTNP